MNNCIITTEDLKQDYVIIGPVHFCISKEFFERDLEKLVLKYEKKISEIKRKSSITRSLIDWSVLYWDWVSDKTNLDKLYYIGVEELKERAKMVHGDAVIGMRQNIQFGQNGCSLFEMYGTAVRLKSIQR